MRWTVFFFSTLILASCQSLISHEKDQTATYCKYGVDPTAPKQCRSEDPNDIALRSVDDMRGYNGEGFLTATGVCSGTVSTECDNSSLRSQLDTTNGLDVSIPSH